MNNSVLRPWSSTDAAGNLYAGGFFTTAGGVLQIHRQMGRLLLVSPRQGDGTYLCPVPWRSTARATSMLGGISEPLVGVNANRIAKWDGTSWSALDTGMNDLVGLHLGSSSGS